MSSQGVARLRILRQDIQRLGKDVHIGQTIRYPIDDNQDAYYQSELDTLMAVLDLMDGKHYKECFIVLRTVFEKFLFFWLMLDGKKCRTTLYYRIDPITSKTPKEGRDKTLELWRKLQKQGDQRYAQVAKIRSGKLEDEIAMDFIDDGTFMKDDKLRIGEWISAYNFALDDFRPNVVHLSDLSIIKEGEIFGMGRLRQYSLQKDMHRNFFTVESMTENLKLNRLVTVRQAEKIMVHYNFLSHYVHPSKDNLDIWKDKHSAYWTPRKYEDRIYERLVFLYVAKLMHLYAKAFVKHYTKFNAKFKPNHYKALISELARLSNDLWFFDNKPTKFDVQSSDARKHVKSVTKVGQLSGKMKKTKVTLYYEDPLERMRFVLSMPSSLSRPNIEPNS